MRSSAASSKARWARSAIFFASSRVIFMTRSLLDRRRLGGWTAGGLACGRGTPPRQPAWTPAFLAAAAPHHLREPLHQLPVELRAGAAGENGQRLGGGLRRLVVVGGD